MFTVPTGTQTIKAVLVLLCITGVFIPSYFAYRYYKQVQELEEDYAKLEQTVQAVLVDLDKHAKLYKDTAKSLKLERDIAEALYQELEQLRGSTPEISTWESQEIPREVLNVLRGGRDA